MAAASKYASQTHRRMIYYICMLLRVMCQTMGNGQFQGPTAASGYTCTTGLHIQSAVARTNLAVCKAEQVSASSAAAECVDVTRSLCTFNMPLCIQTWPGLHMHVARCVCNWKGMACPSKGACPPSQLAMFAACCSCCLCLPPKLPCQTVCSQKQFTVLWLPESLPWL